MEDRRTWRPLPGTHPDVPQLVISATFGAAAYKVQVSDLVHVWSETMERRDICMRGFAEDLPIDPSYDKEQMAVFLDKLRAALEPGHAEHGTTSLSLAADAGGDGAEGGEGACLLLLHVTVELPGGLRPLRWPMRLAQGRAAVLADEFALPLLRARRERAREAVALRAALREKDAVIAKMADKLEALGAGLASVFPALAGRHPQKQPPTRAAMEEHVPGLAPFSAEQLRRLMPGEDHCGDGELVCAALGDGVGCGGELACAVAAPSHPGLEAWWLGLGKSPGVTLEQPVKSPDPVRPETPLPADAAAAAAAAAAADDDYVYRTTPKKDRAAAAAEEAPSSPTPQFASSPPLPPPPPPQKTGKAGKLGRLGAIGRKKMSTPPPAEPGAAAVPPPPTPPQTTDSGKRTTEADDSDTASEAGDMAQTLAAAETEEQARPAAAVADVSVRPKSSGGRSLGRIGKDKETAAAEAAAAEAAAAAAATEEAAAKSAAERAAKKKRDEDEAKQKERLQQVVERQAAPVRKKRKF